MKPSRLLALRPLEDRLAPALATWDGGGGNNLWTTPSNWVGDVAPNPGDDLSFSAGAAQLISVNDFPVDTTFNSLTLANGDYQVSGNRISVLDHVLIDSASSQTIELSIAGPASMTKTGPGLLQLSGTNTFTGQFDIQSGYVLLLTGTIAGPAILTGSGTVAGSGTLGTTGVSGGTIDPGFAPVDAYIGVVNTGNLSIDQGKYIVHIGSSPGLGLDSDQLFVHGSVTLGGTLEVSLAGFVPPGPLNPGTVTIIDNDGTDAVQETFAGLPEGATVSLIGGQSARISYRGGDGNDVTLTIVTQTPVPAFSVGAGAGGGPQVNIYAVDGTLVRAFNAYDPSFRGGVCVATAEFTGDLVKDVVTAAGAGGGPHVRVFDGITGAVVREFFAYDAGFTGGVFVAAGDVNGDGRADVVTGAGAGGGPHVKAFSGVDGSLLTEFLAYADGFRGGVSVAAGDTTLDGVAEIITGAGPGGGPHVRVFNAATRIDIVNFFAYDQAFRGGVNVAYYPDLLGGAGITTAPGFGLPPDIRVFPSHGLGDVFRFNAYDANFIGGVNVGFAPIGVNGTNVILTGAGATGGSHVKAIQTTFSAPPVVQLSFLAFDPAFLGGVFVG